MRPHGSGLSEARVASDFRTSPICEFLAKHSLKIAAASSTYKLPFVGERRATTYL